MTPEAEAEVRGELRNIRLTLAEMQEPDEHLDDEKRERFRAKLCEQTDAELVYDLLGMQKVAEGLARGRAKLVCEAVTTAIAVVLDRFAPQALDEGLAIYYEHTDDDDDEEDE